MMNCAESPKADRAGLARQEMAWRTLARRNLLSFCEYVTTPKGLDKNGKRKKTKFKSPPHIKLLIEKLEAVERGEIKRLIVSCPPRHGKSWMCSRFFPAWFLGRNPDKCVMLGSYSASYAKKWGGKAKELLQEHGWKIFKSREGEIEGVGVRGDTKAKDEWEIAGHEGGMKTDGVGGSFTGRGADLMVIDDPVKNSEEANSEVYRERAWEWYDSTAHSRLEPGGAVVVIMCMTGDTPVLMADGTEKPLKRIRPGDSVATYESGAIGHSTVKNWINQGTDSVYEIRMSSGISVKANERHPFLVQREGGVEWVRLKNLKPGDAILKAIGVNGGALSVQKRGANYQLNAKVCATHITVRAGGQGGYDRHQPIQSHGGQLACGIDTELNPKITRGCSKSRAAPAPYANNLQETTFGRIGAESYASTIAMRQEKSEGCCVTIATSRSDTAKPLKSSSTPLNTYRIIADEIVEIVEAGREDVFDIEVERTGNFIANGLVSHNTRWHEDDLVGRLLKEEEEMIEQGEEPEGWEKVIFPAIADGEVEDALGRKKGEALWPERFPADCRKFKRIKRRAYVWSALYQQKPTLPEGNLFKSKNFRYYRKLRENSFGRGEVDIYEYQGLRVHARDMHIFTTTDPAFSEAEAADWTVVCTWGFYSGYLWLLDLNRGHFSKLELVSVFKSVIEQFGLVRNWVEKGAFKKGKRTIDYLRSKGIPVSELTPEQGADKEKYARADSAQPWFEEGRVLFPESASWLYLLIEELLPFPRASHDDQVDAVSYGVLVAPWDEERGFEFSGSEQDESSFPPALNRPDGW